MIQGLLSKLTPPPVESVSFTVEVDAQQPAAERLCRAALNLHQVQVTRNGGVVVTRNNPVVLKQDLDEFFDALGEVVGKVMSEDIREALGANRTSSQLSLAPTLNLARQMGLLG